MLTPTEATSGRAPAASQRPVPAPRHTSHRRGSRITRQTRVHANSPVRSSPRLWPPGWNGPPLGSPPGLRTPPTKSRTTHARVGTGHRARTWNYTLNSFVNLQSGSSLVVCDIGSHVANAVVGSGPSRSRKHLAVRHYVLLLSVSLRSFSRSQARCGRQPASRGTVPAAAQCTSVGDRLHAKAPARDATQWLLRGTSLLGRPGWRSC